MLTLYQHWYSLLDRNYSERNNIAQNLTLTSQKYNCLMDVLNTVFGFEEIRTRWFTRAHADGVRFVYSSENCRSILWTPWILFQCIIAFKKIYYREDITDCNRHTIVFYKSKLQRSMSLAYGVPGCYCQLLEACVSIFKYMFTQNIHWTQMYALNTHWYKV